MFLLLHPRIWYNRTKFFWTIIVDGCIMITSKRLFFINLIIWKVPYIISWVDIRQYWFKVNTRAIFINALICHSGILVDFFHYCLITVHQEDNYKKSEKNIENNIATIPRCIIVNVAYSFGKFLIHSHTSEFCIQSGR